MHRQVYTHCAVCASSGAVGGRQRTTRRLRYTRAMKYCMGQVSSLGKSRLIEGNKACMDKDNVCVVCSAVLQKIKDMGKYISYLSHGLCQMKITCTYIDACIYFYSIQICTALIDDVAVPVAVHPSHHWWTEWPVLLWPANCSRHPAHNSLSYHAPRKGKQFMYKLLIRYINIQES